ISFNGKIEITHNAAGSPDSVTVTGDGVTGVEDELQPLTYSLEQNYPNPFNPSTKIKYSVPQSSQVQIKIFDVLGNEIETLVNEEKRAGTYEINWNAINLPSGVYFYQLRAGEFVSTKKMILLK
ncbi:MAG: T9SS type A sorting domain-containing protein, partial [Ignavibacteriaceae bacterium]|nr:T9SS type A sorting domain-containing protein [Ignavibacteriaceae bacterium]